MKSQRIVNCSSPEHGGSGSDHEFLGEPASSHGLGFRNFDFGVSEGMNFASSNAEYYDVIVDQKVKSEEIGKICIMKRKKDLDEGNPNLRLESINPQLSSYALNEDEEKRKARLMRNRESLRQQLSGSGMRQPPPPGWSKKNEIPVVNDIFGNVEGVPGTLTFVGDRLYNHIWQSKKLSEKRVFWEESDHDYASFLRN
ncbi:bZIP transcription factor 17, partial [Cucurbita argyrosperma subsp. sororia]